MSRAEGRVASRGVGEAHMIEPFVFVSYRRSDTAPYALGLKSELEQRLTSAFVFIDTQRIRTTDHWPEALDDALSRARVLIALIGTRWVECEDCEERPRLFARGDWVRKEIGYFLKNTPQAIIPVLVDGGQMPVSKELPSDLAMLSNIQATNLDSSRWHECVSKIARTLADRFDFKLKDEGNKNPAPDSFRKQLTKPIDTRTLEQALSQFLAGWQVINCYDREESGLSQWLVKSYTFPSFQLAMKFMQDGSVVCESLNHHPTWENCYKEVSVKLTTWNAGYKITQFDIELARRLDRIARATSK